MSLRNKILSRLGSVDIIALPPPILSEVLTLIDPDNSSAKRLADVILKDPMLTARILKVANSPFYGCRQRVNTVDQAVLIIGLNAVKCLVLSISIYNQVSTQNSINNDGNTRLWRHFLETATAAKEIANRIKYDLPEEAYIAGLLHDFGMLFLQRHFAAEMAQVRNLIIKGVETSSSLLDSL